MKSKKKWVGKVILAVAIILLLFLTYVSADICVYGNRDGARQADAAIVLGAGIDGDQPSPAFRERIKHAIYLYQNGTVKKLIFTGGVGKGETFSESSVAKRYAIAHSVRAADIFIEETSKITQENIRNAIPIVNENRFASVILVSDPLHMKRAMLIAADYGLTAYSSPTPTSVYRSMVNKSLFLFREVFFYEGVS